MYIDRKLSGTGTYTLYQYISSDDIQILHTQSIIFSNYSYLYAVFSKSWHSDSHTTV